MIKKIEVGDIVNTQSIDDSQSSIIVFQHQKKI